MLEASNERLIESKFGYDQGSARYLTIITYRCELRYAFKVKKKCVYIA